MADLKIGLDVRDVQQAAAIFQQALYDNGKVVDDFAVKLAEFNNKGTSPLKSTYIAILNSLFISVNRS